MRGRVAAEGDTVSDEIAWLLAVVADDPGAKGFPAVADALRRGGHLKEARQVASAGLERAPDSVAGRVALGLVLLELGDREAVRAELAKIVEQLSPLEEIEAQLQTQSPLVATGGPVREAPIADAEIESAFEQAESDPEQMVDVNALAQEAMRREALDGPEGEFVPKDRPAFATATMADLLEKQGDIERAQAIRASISGDADTEVAFSGEQAVGSATSPPTTHPRPSSRDRELSTLEGWLQNIRRGVA